MSQRAAERTCAQQRLYLPETASRRPYLRRTVRRRLPPSCLYLLRRTYFSRARGYNSEKNMVAQRAR